MTPFSHAWKSLDPFFKLEKANTVHLAGAVKMNVETGLVLGPASRVWAKTRSKRPTFGLTQRLLKRGAVFFFFTQHKICLIKHAVIPSRCSQPAGLSNEVEIDGGGGDL
jgi:hypothetical protein